MTEPHLTISRTWEVAGNRLRLHADSMKLGDARGVTWLTLSARDAKRIERDEVFVTLPLDQAAAVAEAADAFNAVMNRHERESAGATTTLPQTE